MKVCITTSNNFDNKSAIKDAIWNLVQSYPDVTIASLGKEMGLDRFIKKCALEFDAKYIEFNEFHTPYNLYSYMPERMYKKSKSQRNTFIRNTAIASSCKVCLIFMRNNTDYDISIQDLVKRFEKKNKKIQIFTSQ